MKITTIIAGVFLILIIGLRSSSFGQRYSFNRMAQKSVIAILTNPTLLPVVAADWAERSTNPCRANWFEGLIANELHEDALRDRFWKAALRCSPDFIDSLRALDPHNLGFAELAVQEHPGFAEAWFWLAELLADETPEEAIDFHYRGMLLESSSRRHWQQLSELFVQLDPQTAKLLFAEIGLTELAGAERNGSIHAQFIWARIVGQESPEVGAEQYLELLLLLPNDGIYWKELGDLLRKDLPDAAIEAYLQSCFNDDPGSNGCLRAGSTAESIGDYQAAIDYYRLSKWSGSLDRADDLERELSKEPGS